MNETQIPQSPIPVENWTAPTDPDLKWISLLNYTVARLLEDARVQGFKLRQVTESDAETMINDANAQIAQTLADISELYNPTP